MERNDFDLGGINPDTDQAGDNGFDMTPPAPSGGYGVPDYREPDDDSDVLGGAGDDDEAEDDDEDWEALGFDLGEYDEDE